MVSPRWNKRHCLMICWRRSEKKKGSLILRLLSSFGALGLGLCAAVGNTFCKNAHGVFWGSGGTAGQANEAMEACCSFATVYLLWQQRKFRGVFFHTANHSDALILRLQCLRGNICGELVATSYGGHTIPSCKPALRKQFANSGATCACRAGKHWVLAHSTRSSNIYARKFRALMMGQCQGHMRLPPERAVYKAHTIHGSTLLHRL